MLPPPPTDPAPPARAPRRPVLRSRLFRRLADVAAQTHGRLLILGVVLLFLAGVLTLVSYLLRDPRTGAFHVYWLFLWTGLAALAAGAIWRWRAKRRGLK
jgi:hypothetical protein